ncbi:DUF2231 domain-containing protein [Kaarinaea lacus]
MIEIIPNWHPFFVHFAIALLLIATVFHVVAALNNKSVTFYQFENVANWNLWIGAVFAIITVIAGWFAYNSVEHDTPSHLAMTDHRNWGLGTAALYVVLAIWSLQRARKSIAISWLIVVPLIVASGLLTVTGWKGGELVYRYGLGVMALPNTGVHDHAAHNHGTDEPKLGEQGDIIVEDTREEAEHEVGEKAHIHEQDGTHPPESNNTTEAVTKDSDSAAKVEESHSGHDHSDHKH